MSELSELTARRDKLLERIREIKASCEGIENENNAQRVQELNLEQAKLNAQKRELSEKLSALNSRLSAISAEMTNLSGTGVDRIHEAIKNQRWYFFTNKTKIVFDKNTAKLYPNIPLVYAKDENGGILSNTPDIISDMNLDGFSKWIIPNKSEVETLVHPSNKFPFLTVGYTGSDDHPASNNVRGYICNYSKIYCTDLKNYLWLDYDYPKTTNAGLVVPYCTELVNAASDYLNMISRNNASDTDEERMQSVIDFFLANDLQPVFEDDEITELYKKIYIDKPVLMQELQNLQTKIESMQTVVLLSSEFDYTLLLAKYDIKAIDASVIKYYQAVQQWTAELMEKIDYYEKAKEQVIQDFNTISLKLSRKYENSPRLTSAENELLSARQKYFRKEFSLGMSTIKSKILAVRKQADDLEYRIDEIDCGENSIHELALLEQQPRASFSFIAENTAKIIKNALRKIEYFEAHHMFVLHAVEIWDEWTEDFKIFKTTHRETLKHSCEEDGIEEEIWQDWYEEWENLRFAIEAKVQSVIERELKAEISTLEERDIAVSEYIIRALENYKKNIDSFYLEERKSIYQKFAFQSGGDVQDKFETESCLYRYTYQFQAELQKIMFNCAKTEDRIFIQNWSYRLLEIQIDEILNYLANAELKKISHAVLDEFSTLKLKNYDAYFTDSKAYSDEMAGREKKFNSLVFKMRKDLNKPSAE